MEVDRRDELLLVASIHKALRPALKAISTKSPLRRGTIHRVRPYDTVILDVSEPIFAYNAAGSLEFYDKRSLIIPATIASSILIHLPDFCRVPAEEAAAMLVGKLCIQESQFLERLLSEVTYVFARDYQRVHKLFTDLSREALVVPVDAVEDFLAKKLILFVKYEPELTVDVVNEGHETAKLTFAESVAPAFLASPWHPSGPDDN